MLGHAQRRGDASELHRAPAGSACKHAREGDGALQREVVEETSATTLCGAAVRAYQRCSP
eukprot:3371898-Pyramimonas_sp.AAC.1